MEKIEDLIQQLDELKSLRDRLVAVDNAEELDEYSADIRVYLKDEIDYIDKELKELEEKAKKKAEVYTEYYDKIKIAKEENLKKLEEDNLLSEEELAELRNTTANELKDINKKSQEVKKEYDEYERVIRVLRKQKTEINNRIKISEALGLTYNEYKNVYATIKSRNAMKQAYEAKGLGNIAEKKASERTKEEQKILDEAKEEILKEISKFKSEHKAHSASQAIEALYLLDTNVKKGEDPKVYDEIFDINNAKININEFAHKVVDSSIKETAEVKEEIPEDMKDATTNEKVDINTLKPANEKVTLFKDIDTKDYYVRRYAVDRFKLESVDFADKARINGSLCYKISASDVEKIKENANNEFSPYITSEKEVKVEKGLDEISPEDTKNELIPGTNIKKPRDRKDGEEPEDYKNFITKYYDKVFATSAAIENNDEPIEAEKIEDAVVIDIQEEKEPTEIVDAYEETPIEEVTPAEEIPTETHEETTSVEEEIPTETSEKTTSVEEESEEDIKDIYNEELETTEETKENNEESFEIEMPSDGIVITVDDDDKEIEDIYNDELDKVKEEITDIYEDELSNVKEDEDKEIEDAFNEAIDEVEETTEPVEEVVEEYEAENIEASQEFKDELKKGNILYNIVHSVPKLAKKLGNKIKGLFEPDHTFDEEEIVEEDKPKQR